MALTTVRSTGIGSLPAISGANLTSLNASNISSGTLNSARFSGGKISQIIQSTSSSVQGFTSATLTDVNPTATITPTATSSKVLAIFNGPVMMINSAASYGEARIYRDSTELKIWYDIFAYTESIGGTITTATQTCTFNYLDSPNTTSAVTYKVKIAEHGSSTLYFNNSGGSGGAGMTTMTLMEILA
jgi:hypothetical protein